MTGEVKRGGSEGVFAFGDGNESGGIVVVEGDCEDCCGESTAAIVYCSTGRY